jgi:hypothetical protein
LDKAYTDKVLPAFEALDVHVQNFLVSNFPPKVARYFPDHREGEDEEDDMDDDEEEESSLTEFLANEDDRNLFNFGAPGYDFNG